MDGFFGESAARPLIAGHRGCMFMFPENTMLGFRKAHALGVDMLEIDLRETGSGEIVLLHDAAVDRTTNGHGPVKCFSLAQLQQLDAGQGEKIPLFEEFLAWVQHTKLLLNVEIKTKTRPFTDKAIALLERYNMRERSVIACFDADITQYACRQHGMKTQGFPQWNMQHFKPESYDYLYSVGIEMCDLTPALAAEFHERGIQPWCWCADTAADVERMRRSGATLCTCNDPTAALRILRQPDPK